MGLDTLLEPSEAGQISPFTIGATGTEPAEVGICVGPPVDGPQWQFRARPPTGRPEELGRFHARLCEALRIAHGLRATFRIEFGSGPHGAITFTAGDPNTGRWFGRVLSAAYEHQRWILGGPSSEIQPLAIRIGAPLLSWPHPLRSGLEATGWGDSIALGIGLLPAGLSVVWSLRSAGSPRSSLAHPTARPLTPSPLPNTAARFVGPISEIERRWRDRWEEQQQALCWSASVAVVGGPGVPALSSVEALSDLVQSVTRSPGGNGLRFRRPSRWWSRAPTSFVMTEPEVMGLLPTLECTAAGASSRRSRLDGPIILGRTSVGAPLELRVDPREGRHLAVLGETGMGKSTLLAALARRAGTGHGVVMLDPVGDTGRALLSSLGPDARTRAVWVSPADSPVGLNALASGGPENQPADPRQISDIVQALRRVRSGRYAESTYWGPRIEEMVTRALLAAGSLPGGTLVDALELLEDPERHRPAIAGEAGAAWHQLTRRARERPEELDGARRLLYEIVGNPVLARLLCERHPRWSRQELMVEGRIVVVTGDVAAIGEGPARHLLAMYLALLWSEILARPHPTKTFVILDEAQWFGHEALSEILQIGRRFNVHLVVTTQALGSLSEGVREAIATNVADFVLFRGSPEDAREFGRIARSVSPEEVLSLRRGEAILLRGKGEHFDRLRTVAHSPSNNGPETLRQLARSSVARFGAEDPLAMGRIVAPSAVVAQRSIGVDAAAQALLDHLANRPDAEPVRVHLNTLARGEGDGSVRALGTILGRGGALRRHGRDEQGAYWEFRPGEVRATLRARTAAGTHNA